jgi:hypothetical protein
MGRSGGAAGSLTDGLVTGAAVVLAYLAFDDITTDTAASFGLEYASSWRVRDGL